MKEKNIKIIDIINKSALILLMLICNVIIVSSLLFFIKISITKINIIIAVIVTMVEYILLNRKNLKNVNVLLAIILAIIIFSASIFICSKTYDVSWDANTYHKLAVGSLKNGWNPVYENIEEYNKEQGNVIDIEKEEQNIIWTNHYAKGSWLFAANIYSYTNNIEAAKNINILMIYIVFGITLKVLSGKANKICSTIIALLISVNPISMVQVFTYYIDGLLGLLLALVFLSLVCITLKKENIKENIVILSCSILILINLKFTGLVYAGMFCFLFYCYWLYKAYKEKNLKQVFTKCTMFYAVLVIGATCIVGYSPYVKNVIQKGHPFYPLFGEGKVDIITINQPYNFNEKSTIRKFVLRILAVPSNTHYNDYPGNQEKETVKIKVPFTTNSEEILKFSKFDLRFSGFGPWFSGIFIISTIITIYILIKLFKKNNKEYFIIYLLLLLGTGILILVTDGSWWARYTPYVYFIPIYNIIYLLLNWRERRKIHITLATIMIILMIINMSFIIYAQAKVIFPKYSAIKNKYETFALEANSNKTLEVKLTTNYFEGVKYNIYDVIGDRNIVYKDKITGNKKYIQYFWYKTY